jgi:hypothetical protein
MSTVSGEGRRAAQNAARIEDDGHLEVAGAQSLDCWVMQLRLRLVPVQMP